MLLVSVRLAVTEALAQMSQPFGCDIELLHTRHASKRRSNAQRLLLQADDDFPAGMLALDVSVSILNGF